MLTDRLNRLVDEDIFERVRYNERPERYEYGSRRRAASSSVALTALREWGDGTCSTARRASAPPQRREAVTAALVPKGTKTVAPRDVELVPRDG